MPDDVDFTPAPERPYQLPESLAECQSQLVVYREMVSEALTIIREKAMELQHHARLIDRLFDRIRDLSK